MRWISISIYQIFRIDRVDVEPARSSFDLGLGLLGPAPISDETVAKLRAIPGVVAAAPRMRLAFPAKAWGGAQIIGRDPSVIARRFGDFKIGDLALGGGRQRIGR